MTPETVAAGDEQIVTGSDTTAAEPRIAVPAGFLEADHRFRARPRQLVDLPDLNEVGVGTGTSPSQQTFPLPGVAPTVEQQPEKLPEQSKLGFQQGYRNASAVVARPAWVRHP